MSRTHKDATGYRRKERPIAIRAVRRNPPDLRKLSRAIVALALAEAEAEAAATGGQTRSPGSPHRAAGTEVAGD